MLNNSKRKAKIVKAPVRVLCYGAEEQVADVIVWKISNVCGIECVYGCMVLNVLGMYFLINLKIRSKIRA